MDTIEEIQERRLARLRDLEDAARAGDQGALPAFARVAEQFLATARLIRLADSVRR